MRPNKITIPHLSSLSLDANSLIKTNFIGNAVLGNSFVFETTNNIDCCNINALGDMCNLPENPSDLDIYGGLEVYQTVFLVISNFLFLMPAFKAFLIKNYSRVFLILVTMIVSSFYHLCKTSSPSGGGTCLLQFCTLKYLDYASSNTLLISLVLFFIPFTIEEEEEEEEEEALCAEEQVKKKHSSQNQAWPLRGKSRYQETITNNKEIYYEKENIQKRIEIKKYRFIEDYLLIIYFELIYITLQSTLFCSGKHTLSLSLSLIGSSVVIAVIGHLIIIRKYANDINGKGDNSYKKIYEKYNKVNIIVGIILAFIAIMFFVIEDYMDPKFYWITHVLWHTFAAFSALFLFDSRSKTRTGMFSLCFCCIPK
jgi:hypothetical protein